MNEEARKIINQILEIGPVSPKNVMNVALDLGVKKIDFQITVQIGLETGAWHLDREMNLAKGGRGWTT